MTSRNQNAIDIVVDKKAKVNQVTVDLQDFPTGTADKLIPQMKAQLQIFNVKTVNKNVTFSVESQNLADCQSLVDKIKINGKRVQCFVD